MYFPKGHAISTLCIGVFYMATYKQTVKLPHTHRVTSITDVSTGEVTDYEDRSISVFSHPKDFLFFKLHEISIDILMQRLKPTEITLVLFLMKKIGKNNSLAPLGDKTSFLQLEAAIKEYTNGNQTFTSQTLKRLTTNIKKMGIIKSRNEIWFFNPYIALKSKVIHRDVIGLFSTCEITQEITKKYKGTYSKSFILNKD